MEEQHNKTHFASTASFWAVAYALSQGVTLLDMHYRPKGEGRHRFYLDDTDGQASRALDTWFTGAPVGNLRAFISAYYVLVDAIHAAQDTATPAELARGA
jgi:hypothetical protein